LDDDADNVPNHGDYDYDDNMRENKEIIKNEYPNNDTKK